MRNELANFCFRHLIGVPFVVKKNETPDPADICAFCAQAEMPDTYDSPYLIQQFRCWHSLEGDLVKAPFTIGLLMSDGPRTPAYLVRFPRQTESGPDVIPAGTNKVEIVVQFLGSQVGG